MTACLGDHYEDSVRVLWMVHYVRKLLSSHHILCTGSCDHPHSTAPGLTTWNYMQIWISLLTHFIYLLIWHGAFTHIYRMMLRRTEIEFSVWHTSVFWSTPIQKIPLSSSIILNCEKFWLITLFPLLYTCILRENNICVSIFVIYIQLYIS